MKSDLEERKERIYSYIKSEDYVPLKRKEFYVILDIPTEDKALFDEIIAQLLKEGKVIESKKGKIMLPKEQAMASGVFTGNLRGFGFVKAEEGFDRDIFIPAEHTAGAMHRDRVMVRVTQKAEGTKRAEGQVVKILEKGTENIVGTFQRLQGFGFVVPDDKKIGQDIFIAKENAKSAVSGHKVVVKITKRQEGNRSPEGVIKEILGHIDDPGVDILSIIHQFDLPIEFEDEVYKQVDNIPLEISPSEMEGREDFRSLVTVTIDGDDSKDFDDAVSLEVLDNGNYRLGVHIADVTHYVTEGSPLDKEALSRGTSYYLVDRVIPMLPHKLSNGICSLNPKEDRLTLSCIMEINKNGDVENHKICESIISSHERMTYTNVNKIIEDEDKDLIKQYEEFVPMLKGMDELRKTLGKKRVKRGSVNFDFPEAKIVLNSEGKVIDIKASERNSATNLIEEFMLVCNETVAEDYYWQERPFVYRNHETPDEERIQTMKNMLRTFGYRIKGQNEIHPKDVQAILEKAAGSPEEHIVSRIVLRSMKQARYQEENFGHFGLASKYYCHFTSPIRRYPDLQIHRIIKENLRGKLSEKRISRYYGILPEVCKRSSARERLAEEAERETDKLKMVEYMEERIGEEFEGIISGVTGWGIYVELPNTVEGMIPLNSLEGDFYAFDEENLQVVGAKTGKKHRLGDKVRVVCTKADKEMRTIDFGLVN